jgi:hypothetical protein
VGFPLVALAGQGLGQAVAVAPGLDEVREVHQPVDSGGRYLDLALLPLG